MLAHVFIGNASRLSLSFDSRVEARTTLCSRAQATVLRLLFQGKIAVKDPETGVQRSWTDR